MDFRRTKIQIKSREHAELIWDTLKKHNVNVDFDWKHGIGHVYISDKNFLTYTYTYGDNQEFFEHHSYVEVVIPYTENHELSKHPHAELMFQYAQDATETDQPWERWETVSDGGVTRPLRCHPHWLTDIIYRRKQKTIQIGNVDIPEPMQEEPNRGDEFWIVTLYSLVGHSAEEHLVTKNFWWGSQNQKFWLESGICHRTKQDGEKHAKALLKLTSKEQDYD